MLNSFILNYMGNCFQDENNQYERYLGLSHFHCLDVLLTFPLSFQIDHFETRNLHNADLWE